MQYLKAQKTSLKYNSFPEPPGESTDTQKQRFLKICSPKDFSYAVQLSVKFLINSLFIFMQVIVILRYLCKNLMLQKDYGIK